MRKTNPSPHGLLFERFLQATGCNSSEMTAIRLSDCKAGDSEVEIEMTGKRDTARKVRVPLRVFKDIIETFGGKTWLFETPNGKPYDEREMLRQIALLRGWPHRLTLLRDSLRSLLGAIALAFGRRYTGAMRSSERSAHSAGEGMRRFSAVLEWVGYVTTALVVTAELRSLPLGPRFALTAGLLAMFAALLVVLMRASPLIGTGAFVVMVLTASVLVIAIMAISPRPPLGSIFLYILCAMVAGRVPLGFAIAWVTCASIAFLTCLILAWDHERSLLPILLAFWLGCSAIIGFSVSFRRLLQASAESEQLLAELTVAQGRLKDLAITEERARIAREMHDAVGHRLTVAAVLLEGAAGLIPPESGRAIRMVESSRREVKQGLDELRAAVSALRVNGIGDQPLLEVLKALAQVFAQGAEMHVTLDLQPNIPEPDFERKLVIIRTVQEALTNVQKHAAATSVEISLKARGGAYLLACRDNGRGVVAPSVTDQSRLQGGFGLPSLRTRAAVFGGTVELLAASQGGAALRLTLPTAAGAS